MSIDCFFFEPHTVSTVERDLHTLCSTVVAVGFFLFYSYVQNVVNRSKEGGTSAAVAFLCLAKKQASKGGFT